MGKRIGLSLVFSLFSFLGFAQGEDVEMADLFREEGKIYVVVAVVALVLFGLFMYLIFQDLRLRKLEKGSKHEN